MSDANNNDNNNKNQPPVVPLRVAMLGAGLFATNSHAPILINHKDVMETKAVWSRRKESAEKLAIQLHCPAFGGEEELDMLITQRPDIDAYIVALPLDVQPTIVLRLLKAGKHVLSEKPIAPTVAIAKQLINEYQTLISSSTRSSVIWSVAENYRYEPAIQKVAEIVQQSSSSSDDDDNNNNNANGIGEILLMQVTVKNPFLPNNPYLNTSWRKNPTWYGGFFIDSFVHTIAGMRCILPKYHITQVSAMTSHHASEYLPEPDTMVGHVTWSNTNNVHGSITASYAANTYSYIFEITGRQGTIVLQRSTTTSPNQPPGYNIVVTKGMGPNAITIQNEFIPFGGLVNEFLAFANACHDCTHDHVVIDNNNNKNTPQQALKDLEIVEALLESGKQGGAIVQIV